MQARDRVRHEAMQARENPKPARDEAERTAAFERLKALDQAERALDEALETARQALVRCEDRYCGRVKEAPRGEMTNIFVFEDISEILLGTEVGLTRKEKAKLARLTGSALCPECEPAFAAAREAEAAYRSAFDQHVAAEEAYYSALDDILTLKDRVRAARRMLESNQEIAQDDSVDSTLRNQAKAEIEPLQAIVNGAERLGPMLAALLELRKTREETQRNENERERAFAAAQDALAACNQRCPDAPPTLKAVIGGTGNNPFEPAGNPPVAGAIGTLQFSSPSYGGAEGGAVLITVVRSGGSTGNVSVRYETLRGSASEDDFKPAKGTLSWNERDATPKSFSIALANDTVVEEVESFSVILSNPGGGATLGSPSTATVSITDTGASPPPQPAGTLQFAQPAYSVSENAGSVPISVTRTGGSAGAVSVQYFTGPGSALAGSDYQQANGVLTWGPGDTGAKTFTVPIINDTTPEGDEGFFVTLNGPTGGATLGAPSTANVTIVDDDAASAPCGATGNAWTPNAGTYMCTGNCEPSNPQALSVNGEIVSITQFHQGGTATFQGCGPVLTSTRNDLRYFLQSNHTATISRSGNTAFNASVRSPTGSCGFTCTKTSP